MSVALTQALFQRVQDSIPGEVENLPSEFSAVVTHWTRIRLVPGSNPGAYHFD